MNRRFSHVLILSDFDGTFAGKGTVSVERNLRAIEAFKKEGGRFTFATGRLPSMMKRVFPPFPTVVNAPLVMCNGAILYDSKTDTNLKEAFFADSEQARKDVRDVLSHFPSLTFACYTDEGLLMEGYTPENVPGKNFRKINLISRENPALIEECCRYVTDTYFDRYRIFRSAPMFAEIVDKSVSKGNAVKDLRAYYEREEGQRDLIVCGIGDYENDIELLERVDLAFCPANALDSVKKVAHRTLCDHNEGAIADLIDYLEAHVL